VCVVSQENTTWAASYPGVAIFSVDESDFALGLADGELTEISSPTAPHRFKQLIVTRADFIPNDNGRSRHRFEQATAIDRVAVPGLATELRTFGTNIQAWIDDGWFPIMCDPSHAIEEWNVVVEYDGQTANVRCNQVTFFNITRAWDRIRAPEPGVDPRGPDFQRQIAEAVARLQATMAYRPTGF
jgi:hypothetical protein